MIFSLSILINYAYSQDLSYLNYENDQFIIDIFSTSDTDTNNRIKEITPKNCMYRSVFLPGYGQLINKQAWKIPVIYTGFAFSIYALGHASGKYQDFKLAYNLRTDGDSTTLDIYDNNNPNSNEPKYSESILKSARDYYRRNMEISVLIITGIYLLNIIDAYVGAHLKTFDVTDDLSVEIMPLKISQTGAHHYINSGLILTF